MELILSSSLPETCFKIKGKSCNKLIGEKFEPLNIGQLK